MNSLKSAISPAFEALVHRSWPYPALLVRAGRIVDRNENAAAVMPGPDADLDALSPDLARLARQVAETRERASHDSAAVVSAGREFCFHASAFPLPAADSGEVDVVIVLHDITIQHEASEELARVIIDAEAANRELSRNVRTFAALSRLSTHLASASTPEEVFRLLEDALSSTHLFSQLVLLATGDPYPVPLTHLNEVKLDGRDACHGSILWRMAPGLDAEEIDKELAPFLSLASFTLDNMLLYSELSSSLRDLSFRNRVGQALQDAMSPQEVERVLRELLASYLPLQWFGILFEPNDRRFPPILSESVSMAFRGHLTARPEATGSSIAVPVRLVGVGSETETVVHAVLAALSSDRQTFSGSGRLLFLSLVDMAAIALRNTRLYQDVRAHGVAVAFLNEELGRTVKDLSAANQLKTRFVSIVSHEFRTPLTAIYSYVETLLAAADSIDKETNRTFLGVIKEETERLTRLINQLLDLSRIRSRDTLLANVDVDVNDLAHRVATTLRPVADRKRLRIEEAPSAEPAIVTGDPDSLRQVLVNIVGNAIRYNRPDGSVKISVEAAKGNVIIRVRDSGIGIPPEDLDSIFGEFFTVKQTRAEIARSEDAYPDEANSGGGTGTGLGLAIARAIVERHRGRIEVRSDLDSGTEFSIQLPRKGGVG